MDTKIQLLPSQQHFDSFFDLLKEIEKIENKERLVALDNLNEMSPIPEYAFEQVKFPNGKYYLLPIKRDYARLYRGEQKEYPSSKPTLFRNEMSEIDLIISQIKLFEFEHMLNQHPVVKILKNQHGFFIDTFGLAQHYGFKTNLMDFSSDPLIAGFFATCHYNTSSKQYEAYDIDVKQKGVLYILLSTFFHANSSINGFPIRWGDQVNPIGLQPFKRPGLQKAFSVKLAENHDLRNHPGVFRFTFDYNTKDARYFFNLFNKGSKIWVNDDFSIIANAINNADLFSFNSLFRTVVNFNIEKRRIKEIRNILRERRIFFREKLEYFPPRLYEKIKEKWHQQDEEYFFKAIFKRRKYSEKKGWEECVSLEDIEKIDFLRIFQPNDKSS